MGFKAGCDIASRKRKGGGIGVLVFVSIQPAVERARKKSVCFGFQGAYRQYPRLYASEVRYSSLARQFPDTAQALFDKAEKVRKRAIGDI